MRTDGWAAEAPTAWHLSDLKRVGLSFGMLRDKTLQLVGPLSLIAMIWCAELAAHALAIWPTSTLLWYLNIEVFQSFRYILGSFGFGRFGGDLGSAQSLWLPVALTALICAGLIARMKLPLAIASNFSLIYSGLLLYWGLAANHSQQSASFNLDGLSSPTCFLAASIFVVSLLSSTISHRGYWREIFS